MGRHIGSTLMDINGSLAMDGRKIHYRFVGRWAHIKVGQTKAIPPLSFWRPPPQPCPQECFLL